MKLKHLRRCAFGSLIVLLFVLALATIIEKIYGAEQVRKYIYGAWWFVILWGVFGSSSLIYIIRKFLYLQKATFLLHISLGIILLGAFITFISAERGYIHIRQGEISNKYISEKNMEELRIPFNIKLILFDIEYHNDTNEPADFISFLKVDEEMCKVSMNKIYSHKSYRFYQIDYDPDEMGSTLLINHDPWGIGVTYAGYLLLAISMLWMLWLRIGWKGFICVIIPVVVLWFYISQLNPMTPVLRTPMLAAHVSVIMISYLLFILIAIASIVGLCSHRYADRLYQWNSTLLYPALFLLATGIFIGAVWANISWGRYWGWDAKETWALITMLVYALPLHKKSLPLFNTPFKFHLYCVIACFSIAMTFFGVTYFLGGIHSYVS